MSPSNKVRTFRDPKVLLTTLCAVALGLSFFGLHPAIPYLGVAFGSYFALKAAWDSLRDRSLDVNFLMVFAAAGAVAVGRPIEAAVLLFLFSLSSTLESLTLARTKSAIEGLIKLRPETAQRVLDGTDETVQVEDLKKGDQVRVAPYQGIPADGVVVTGHTTVDQSAMTGESMPHERSPGQRVLAGTQNLEGMVVMEVTSEVGDTTLEKIVELVRDAQENKASGERISAWFGQRYTLFVIVAFAISLGIRFLIGLAGSDALYGALTLLVALSPCAVVISTPASTLSALAWAARNGMLVRGGEFIEASGRVDSILLDKTGTLTEGRPKLVEICVCTGVPETVPATGRFCVEEHACWSRGREMSDEAKAVLRMAAAAEQYSTHPIAEAIVVAAREQGIEVPEAAEQRAVAGLGVTAVVDGVQVRIGQRRFFEEGLSPEFVVHAEEQQNQGMTVAVLEYGGRWAALGVRDEPRSEARDLVAELNRLGIREQVMITGDTPETAQAVAAELGLTQVHAGLLPDEKEHLVARKVDQGKRVMMVGDGINDAPSLARATVGVAMGGLGSDVALNAADVVIMHDRLAKIPQLIRFGRRTNAVIRANLVFATGVIAFLTFGSMLWDWLLPSYRNLLLPFAVVGHEGSTVLVILNGLRLLKGP
jgi:Cd2+/Zn2+-exporting ATPase